MTTPPVVSICMVTYGAFDWVQQSIEAVRVHTDITYEIIVVDNGSSDGTREWLRTQATTLTLIEADANLGFAGGNNLAVNYARAPYVCLLNSDAIVGPNWFTPLRVALDSDPFAHSGIAVPVLLNLDDSIQESGVHVDHTGRVEPLTPAIGIDDLELQRIRPVTYGSAACWVLRTSTYRALGGFDCGYGAAYYEDVDFAFAAQSLGRRVQAVPTVRVHHAQGASAPDRDAAVRARNANQARFAARHAARLARCWHLYDLPNEPHRYHSAIRPSHDDRILDVQFPKQHQAALLDDVETLLRQNMFQYNAVRAPQSWFEANATAMHDFQPQARREVITNS